MNKDEVNIAIQDAINILENATYKDLDKLFAVLEIMKEVTVTAFKLQLNEMFPVRESEPKEKTTLESALEDINGLIVKDIGEL